MRRALDWPGLMQAGLKGLHLTPVAFWNLTPQELRIMLGAEVVAPALTRARLDELRRAFPDVTPERAQEATDGADRNAGGPDCRIRGNAGGDGRGGDDL